MNRSLKPLPKVPAAGFSGSPLSSSLSKRRYGLSGFPANCVLGAFFFFNIFLFLKILFLAILVFIAEAGLLLVAVIRVTI